MSDSNEMKNDQKHPRLRLSQAGINAQKAHDDGQPLTVDVFCGGLYDLYLDVLNERIDHNKAQAAVAVANTIVKATALNLKYRELQIQSAKHLPGEAPEPLQLAAGKSKGGKRAAA